MITDVYVFRWMITTVLSLSAFWLACLEIDPNPPWPWETLELGAAVPFLIFGATMGHFVSAYRRQCAKVPYAGS